MKITNAREISSKQTYPQILNTEQNIFPKSPLQVDSSIVDQIKEILINISSKESVANEFILSSLAVPAKLHEIAKNIQANSLQENNPEIWNSVIESAISANNGLGDENSGFLSFSREYGFVNSYNPNLTYDENKMLSQISLIKGIAIEDLPLTQGAENLTNPEIQAQMQNIIQNQGLNYSTSLKQNNSNKKLSFLDKAKNLFNIGKNAYDKIRGIGKNVKGIAEKVRDLGGVLKNTGISFIDKVGGYISKGAGFVSSLF